MQGEREREKGGVTGREMRAVEKQRVGYVIKLCFVEKEMGWLWTPNPKENKKCRIGERERERERERK
jgi:hypothetical protein